jgi:DNA-binding XRE family transcriptional regulator
LRIAGCSELKSPVGYQYTPTSGLVNSKSPVILGLVASASRLRQLREDAARRLYGLPSGSPVRPRQAGLFTIAALAQRIGVQERTLRAWEAGEQTPTARHHRALARELGVKVEDLKLDALVDS